MFFIFVQACRKYNFSYSLNSFNGLTLVLRPNNAFNNIEIKQEPYSLNYFELFARAIKEMKVYRWRCRY